MVKGNEILMMKDRNCHDNEHQEFEIGKAKQNLTIPWHLDRSSKILIFNFDGYSQSNTMF